MVLCRLLKYFHHSRGLAVSVCLCCCQVKQELLRKEAAFALEKKQVNDKLTALNGELVRYYTPSMHAHSDAKFSN